MRVFRLFFVIFVSLIISCSSDNDSKETETNNLLGQWFVISEKWDGEEFANSECSFEQFYQFTQDQEIYIRYLDDSEPECVYSFIEGSYEVNNNVLTLKGLVGADESIYNFNIVSLNSTKLILETTINNGEASERYRIELEKR